MNLVSEGRILLCDFNAARDLSGALRGILESSVRADIESVEIQPSTFAGSCLAELVARIKPDVTFLVLSSAGFRHSRMLFRSIRDAKLPTPILVVTQEGEPRELFELFSIGAVDFVTAPLRASEVLPRVWRLLGKSRRFQRRDTVSEDPKIPDALRQLVGANPLFRAQVEKIPTVARCDCGVLILGETGTGKELFARAIHKLSPRGKEAFVPVNCGAIPTDLAESEIFGHERGAFTGAHAARAGMVEEAQGGTLFLDEVSSLPLIAQAKLLRFLQEKEFRPVGSSKCRRANVRIVAATNERLDRAVSEGKFRQDLYYRLNIVPLTLPPLRERRDDIPLLVRHYLARFSNRLTKSVRDISQDAVERLMAFDWPGNVRELEHVVERAVIFCEHEELRVDDLGFVVSRPDSAEGSFRQAKASLVAQFERSRIRTLLLAYQGNITQAARAAGKNRRAFWELVRKHRIDANEFRLSAREATAL